MPSAAVSSQASPCSGTARITRADRLAKVSLRSGSTMAIPTGACSIASTSSDRRPISIARTVSRSPIIRPAAITASSIRRISCGPATGSAFVVPVSSGPSAMWFSRPAITAIGRSMARFQNSSRMMAASTPAATQTATITSPNQKIQPNTASSGTATTMLHGMPASSKPRSWTM